MVVFAWKVYSHQIFFTLFCTRLTVLMMSSWKTVWCYYQKLQFVWKLSMLMRWIASLGDHGPHCSALGLATMAQLCSPGSSILHRAHDCHWFIKCGQPYLLWGRDGENFPRVRWWVDTIVYCVWNFLLVILVQCVDVQQRVGWVAVQCRCWLGLDLVQSHTGGSSSGGYVVVVTCDKSPGSRHSSACLGWVQDLVCRMRGV